MPPPITQVVVVQAEHWSVGNFFLNTFRHFKAAVQKRGVDRVLDSPKYNCGALSELWHWIYLQIRYSSYICMQCWNGSDYSPLCSYCTQHRGDLANWVARDYK